MYEAIIIGAGPAGLSAAIYLGRAKLKTLLIGEPLKSQVLLAHIIMNYFGFPEGITGKELMKKGVEQAKKYNVKVITKNVIKIIKKDKKFKIKIDDGKIFETKSIIIATGTPIKLSGIENEEKLTGKGVHYCVACDGTFYQNKKLAIIGNGNHAAESALEALLYTKDVTIISNSDKFKFSDHYSKEIKKKKIKLINKNLSSFIGDNKLKQILTMDNKKLLFDGVFMASGISSALNFASELALKNEKSILVVDKNNMTSEPGIFAAGNCVSDSRQIAKSVGDGCNAALSAIKFVRNKSIYQDYSTGG